MWPRMIRPTMHKEQLENRLQKIEEQFFFPVCTLEPHAEFVNFILVYTLRYFQVDCD